MTQPLTDPQLEALAAADPANFLAGSPAVPVIAKPRDIAAVGVELAVAFLVVRGLIARFLEGQDPRQQEVTVVAGQAWANHAPLWLQMAVPAIKQAYHLGDVSWLSEEELHAMATDYAAELGDYMNGTSGEAIAAGFQQQLDKKWSEQVAWMRASQAYGLDAQQMKAYLSGAMSRAEAAEKVDPVPLATRAIVDRLLIARADRMGETESWRAMESGKAIAWMLQQQAGALPADAQREWDNTDEAACELCQAMHQQRAELSQPFVNPIDGSRIWAPGIHPHCRCKVRLYLPTGGIAKAKSGDPYNRDRDGHFARSESRTRKPVTFAEPPPRDPVVDALLAQVTAVNAFGIQEKASLADAFASTKSDLAAAFAPPGLAAAFATPPGGLAAAFNPAPSGLDGAFDRNKLRRTLPAKPTTGRAKRRVVHHVFVQMPKPGEEKQRWQAPYYLPAEMLHDAYEEPNGEHTWSPGDVIDLTDAAISIRYIAEMYDEGAAGHFPESLYAIRANNPMDLVDHEQPYVNDRDSMQRWEEIRPHLRAAHLEALANADDVVERLGENDLRAIFKTAGYDYSEDARTMRARIVRAAQGRDGGDDSLAAAYADWVAWQEPEVLGDNGVELARWLSDIQNDDIRIWDPDDSQFFAFEHGFHEGSGHYEGRSAVDLHASYKAVSATYHSSIMDYGGDGEPWVIGYREISMAPVDEHENLVEPSE